MLKHLNFIIVLCIVLPSLNVISNEANLHNSLDTQPLIVGSNQNITQINSNAVGYCCNYSKKFYNVGAQDYYNTSGINISFIQNTFSFMLKWGNKNSYSLSNIFIIVGINNYESELEMGIKTNYELFSIFGNENITRISINKYYNFSFLNLNSSIILKIRNTNEINYYKLSSKLMYNNLNYVKIIGNFYNFEIGNLSCKNNTFNSFSPKEFNFNNSFLDKNIKLLNNSYSLFDNYSNIFIYVTSTGNLTIFNELTDEETLLKASIANKVESEIENSTSLFFLVQYFNKTYVLVVNKFNLYINWVNIKILNPKLMEVSHMIYVVGKYQFAKIFQNNITNITNIQICSNISGYSFTNAFSKNGEIYMVYSRQNVISFFELVGDKLILHDSFFNCLLYSSHNLYSGALKTNIMIKNTSLFLNNNLSEYSNYNQISERGVNAYNTSNLSFLFVNNTCIKFPFSISCMTGDSTFISFVSKNMLYFYQTKKFNNCVGLNFSAKKRYVISEKGFINVSVESNVNYTIKLSFVNYSVTKQNFDDFFLNLSVYASGIYTYTVQVINLFGIYKFTTGELVINNAKPKIYFTSNISNGVYAGETINVSIKTVFNLTEVIIYFEGLKLSFENDSIHFLIPNFKNISYFEINFTIREQYGINSSMVYKFNYYYECIDNFSINLYNGEIINNNNLSISISSHSQNVSYYLIEIVNISTNGEIIIQSNGTNCIYLLNGNYSIEFFSRFNSGNLLLLNEIDITINSTIPTLNFVTLGRHSYSFFTNSLNCTFIEYINSSISGSWNILINSPIGVCSNFSYFGSHIIINLSKKNIGCTINGLYSLSVVFNSQNHFMVNYSHSFFVNNSLPFLNKTLHVYSNVSYYYLNKILNPNILQLRHYEIINNTQICVNNSIILENNVGYYNIKLVFYNNADAFSTLILYIVYSTLPPAVNLIGILSIENQSFIKIGYNVTGVIPIMNISYNSSNDVLISVSNTSIKMDINSDGPQSVQFLFINLCGNRKIIFFNFTEIYFPQCRSVKIEYNLIFNHLNAELKIDGYSTTKLNITWYSGSKKVGFGSNLNTFFNTGFHKIKITILGYKQVKVLNISIFAIQSQNVYIFILTFIMLFIIFKLPLRFKSESLINQILVNRETKLKEIKKMSRRKRYSKRTLKKVISDLVKSNRILIKKDLNGDEWVQQKQ